jgi:hypothetical protein
MDPATLALVGGIVSMGAGAIGEWLAGASSAEEARLRRAALQQYVALQPPEHREVIARQVGRAFAADVRRNQGLEATQDEVLGRTMDIARDGRSARSDAEYEQSSLDSAQLERSQRMGAVAQAEAQGLGPEAAYSDMLLAGQAGADRERMAGLERAALQEDARMGALASAGGLASQRSATQWAQDMDQANAQDDLMRFNVGEWNSMARFNEGTRYEAFNAELAKADRVAGGYNDLANMNERRGQRTRQRASDIGGGAARAIQAPGTYGLASTPAAGAAAAPRQTTALSGSRGPMSDGMAPAMDQQHQLQSGAPLTTPTRRRLR